MIALRHRHSLNHRRAFSLVEVVLALAICAFTLISLIGLLQVSLRAGKESSDQIQAADLASLLISTRMAATTNSIGNAPHFSIPGSALAGPYQSLPGPLYVGFDGQLSSASAAVYQVTCQAGTNSTTGTGVAQVYLKLTWPPQLAADNPAANRYEVITYVPAQ